MIGIIQFALFFWSYQVGSHSAREGARVGAVDPCNSGAITDRVVDRLAGAVEGTPTVNVTRDASPVKVGDSVTVKVTFTSRSIGGLFSLPDINKSAVARVENVPLSGGC
jgi:hypothetical protein